PPGDRDERPPNGMQRITDELRCLGGTSQERPEASFRDGWARGLDRGRSKERFLHHRGRHGGAGLDLVFLQVAHHRKGCFRGPRARQTYQLWRASTSTTLAVARAGAMRVA